MLNYQVVFTIKDLLNFFVYCLAMGLLYFLIMVFREIFFAIKNINELYKDNKENIIKFITEGSAVVEKTNSFLNLFSEWDKTSIENKFPYITIFKNLIKFFKKDNEK